MGNRRSSCQIYFLQPFLTFHARKVEGTTNRESLLLPESIRVFRKKKKKKNYEKICKQNNGKQKNLKS